MTASGASVPGPSLLFCPADRPDRFRKALAAADVVVLDLEDAVTEGNKVRARQALVDAVVDVDRTIVRINGVQSTHHDADLAALRQTAYRFVMLAKSETGDQVATLAEWSIVALCETPFGVTNAREIAEPDNVIALMWGAEDLVAAMGGRTSRWQGGRYRDFAVHARSAVLLAAKARGRQAIDSIYADYADAEGISREARDAAESGFDLKACIHPTQAGIVRRAFWPTPAEIDRARRVLEAARPGGVVSVDGVMIDGPLVAQAQRTIAWTDRSESDRER